MKKEFVYVIAIFAFVTILFHVVILNYNKGLFDGLQPKAIYKEYKIYDLVEQRGLACAEAVEILDSDMQYEYYFNCLKSDKIYFVSDEEIIKIHEAYDRKIVTKEKLYELDIIDRRVK